MVDIALTEFGSSVIVSNSKGSLPASGEWNYYHIYRFSF